MKQQRLHPERGMSLVELLVAVAILAVALTPLLGIFLHSLKASEKAYKMGIANNLARDLAEEIRAQYFWEPTISQNPALKEGYFPISPSVPQPVGLDTDDSYTTAKTRFETLDDVDDYHGWCRGKECQDFCPGLPAAQQVLCQDETFLETYDGQKYDGKGAYPLYADFTRKVEVFNIFPHEEDVIPEHDVRIAPTDPKPKTFFFYDLREHVLPNLTTHPTDGSARGKTRMKVVRVTVDYSGPVTPPVHIEDLNLVVLPISE